MNAIAQKITSILGSRKFFYIVIAILVVGAGWIAFTASYPMAFDESFHMGIIQIYAHQWSPVLTATPANSGGFGELTHDPSYLYHYLMSFPYRLIELFTKDFVTQVIIMRLLNIGLFVGGLFAFRKLLMRFSVSSALTNLSLLMLVLIPVVPFLAAHINYDNMLFLLLPINILFVLNCAQSITSKHRLGASDFSLMVVFGLLTSLVKYVYLPILAASALYLLGVWLWSKNRKAIFLNLVKSFKTLGLGLKIGLITALLISAGLFMQRYGVNVIMYHDVQPDCSKVETLEHCLQYGPWARNYSLETTAQSSPSRPAPLSIPEFIVPWVGTLIYKLYFAINYDFQEYSPMPLPITLAYVVMCFSIVTVLIFWRSMLKVNRHIWLLAAIILTYALSLLYINYTEYLRFDKIVAVNGRYFIPLLPFIFAIIGLATRSLLSKFWKQKESIIKSSLAIAITLLALQGGGALTYLIHSEPVWYWQDSPLTGFNTQMQKIITPLIIGAKK